MTELSSVAELEGAVGKPLAGMMLKTIDHLDEHCLAILAVSRAAVLGYLGTDGDQRTRLLGGAAGFAGAVSANRLQLDLPEDAAPGGASLLILVPGWRETLRVNGTIAEGRFTVLEAYLHCGKAVIRSGLWRGPEAAEAAGTGPGAGIGGGVLGPDEAAFLAASPFAVISSRDAHGRADSSPRGGPVGDLRPLGPDTVVLADRPGNRRTDTLHNIVEHPEVALLALVPGDDRTLELTGTATVSTDTGLCEQFVEQGKAPKAVIVVQLTRAHLARSAAIDSAVLWAGNAHVDPSLLPLPTRVWTDHVKRNRTRGLGAAVLRAATSERVMRAGVDRDYRQNLY